MDLSFRAYLTSLQFTSTRRNMRSWRFIAELLGEEAILESSCWSEFETRLASIDSGGEADLARAVWKNYGAWRRRAAQRLPG
jgi:hypothetical protein